MAVKSSGSLSMKTDIVGEFGGTAPHEVKEYYRGGDEVPDVTANNSVPTSGQINMKDFYGARNQQTVTLTSGALINGQSNLQEITVSDYISEGDIIVIPSDFWVWSDSISTPAITVDIACTIENNGKVIGKGGNGAGPHSVNYQQGPSVSAQNGGPAIKINSSVSNVIITNKSGAYIAGGGGGGASVGGMAGGGGAGGGDAGRYDFSNNQVGYAHGGVLNAAGTSSVNGLKRTDGSTSTASNGSGSSGSNYRSHNRSGGAGGAGAEKWVGNNDTELTTAGAGGRILPGTGGTARHGSNYGDGGSAGNAGSAGRSGSQGNYPTAAGGGGGWGAAGGSSGGSGGKAVEDSGNTYTLTNNGTIYGATT